MYTSYKELRLLRMLLKYHFSFAYLLKYPELWVICEFKMYTATG